MKVFIVIAAYNEEKSIVNVIRNLKSYDYPNIVVVDDCSKDNTFNVASRQGIFVLHHSINRGQGAALKTGIEFALGQGADIIVTFDADGQHRVEDLKAMIKPVADRKCDVALGSRFLRHVHMPFFRVLTLKIAILVVWFFYGVRMSDAHNGFRALSRKAARMINITSDRMEHASQIVEEINRKKLKYTEVPVTILYNDYTVKHGHGGFFQGITVLWRMLMRKIFEV